MRATVSLIVALIMLAGPVIGCRPSQQQLRIMEEARGLLEARVASGGKLVPVQRGDLRAIKQMQARLHAAGVPAMLTAGPPGG